MRALYVTHPTYLPEDFWVYDQGDYEVVFAWLVPVTESEARFVERHGWQEFEERLAAADPDLRVLDRASVV